jgi:hypothetical protein
VTVEVIRLDNSTSVFDPSQPRGESLSDPTAGAVTTSAARRLQQDVSCLGCGYNLRTLATDARCPECGFEVALTLCGGMPLVDTRARRLRLAGACGALALAMVSPFFEELWAPVQGTKGPGAWWDPAWGYVPIAVVAALALVLFAGAQHRVDGVPLFRRMRRLILATAASYPLALLAWEYAYAWAPSTDFARNRELIHVPLLGVAPGIFLCFRLLCRLARPLGAPRFAPLLRVVTAMWGLIAAIATFVLLDRVPMLQAVSQAHWHRAKMLVGPFLTPLIAIGEIVVAVGYVAGLSLLAILAVKLATSRPRDPLDEKAAAIAAATATERTVR